METPIRFGIVGTGNIARVHAMALKELPYVELRCACDMVPGRAGEFADEYGFIQHAENIDDFIKSRISVAAVCTPHPSHPALVEQLVSHGIHVMVEKPLGVELKSSVRAVEAARLAKVYLGVNFQRRYWPAAQRLREAVDKGRLGKVVQGECIVHFSRTLGYFSKERSPWRGRWDSEGGGVTVNQGIHALDMFQWFMGPIECLFAWYGNETHPGVEVETTVTAAVKFRSGALGSISLGLLRLQTERGFSRVVVYGDSGAWASLHEEPEGAYGLNREWEIPGEQDAARATYEAERADDRRIYRIVEEGRKPPIYYPDCQRAHYEDFFNRIRNNAEPLVNGVEGLKTVEIIEAIYRSARNRQPIDFPLN